MVSSSRRIQQIVLVLIVVVYLIVGALFAVFNPAWQAPDEPPHYNYVAFVATNGCCPLLKMGDWNTAYQTQLTTQRFRPDLLGDLNKLQYENHQPPLYYLFGSIVFKLTGGTLTALRLFGVVIGAGVVVCAYLVSIEVLPNRPQIALGTAALVAFLPQHIAMLASANNDGLAELIIGVTLVVLVRYLKVEDPSKRTPIILGILAGIGLLTKVSTLFLLGLVPAAIFLRWLNGPRMFKTFARDVVLFVLPALILGGVWWGRNISVYGFPDIFGLRQHNTVVADQRRTASRITEIGFGAYLKEAAQTTFNSFWGQFGWMALPMPKWIYRVIQALMLVVVSGLVLDAVRRRHKPVEMEAAQQRHIWIILGLTALLAVAAYIYYNLEFLQYQGRYLYPGLIVFALWMVLGVDAWCDWLAGRIPALGWLAQTYVIVGLFGLFALLDVYLLWRVIVPGLKP
jgi:4-amino-4-deoxy-L-arabinose transferase-like glycosyltransferase